MEKERRGIRDIKEVNLIRPDSRLDLLITSDSFGRYTKGERVTVIKTFMLRSYLW